MAVNDHTDHRDPESGTARDPRLARLLEAAGREEPPSALDAAILAAARKEAGARPLSVPGGGGAGSAGSAPVRAKRNWYVPVSIAAVLVLSVSMVTLVQQEKGDELAQPPRATNVPPPSAAQAPAAVPAPAKLAEEKRTTQAKTAAVPESHADAAQKQRKDKIVVTADSATALGSARRDQVSEATTQAPVPGVVASVKSVPESVAGTGAASAPAPELERRAEPLPAVRERDASAVLSKPATAAPAPPSRSEATPAPSRRP